MCTGRASVSRLRGVDPHGHPEHGGRGELRPVLQQRRADRRTMLFGNGIRLGDGLDPLGRDPRCWSPAWRTCPKPGCGRADPTCRAPTPAPSRRVMLSGSSPRSSRKLPQHAGHQRHHHVVDLDAEVVLDGLDVLEVELGEGDVAVAGDVGVERGLRCGERAAIVRPLRARLHGVDDRGRPSTAATLASFSGRVANLTGATDARSPGRLASPDARRPDPAAARRVRCCTAATSGWRR